MDSAVLAIILLLLLLSLSSGTYFISVCGQRGIWGLDPKLNKPVFIQDYEKCGRSCKLSINKSSIEDLKRLNTFRRCCGISMLSLSAILIVLILVMS
jgi:hypothetical protein